MTLTLELPDDVATRLTAAYPDEAERTRAVLCSIIEVIEAEQKEKAEIIETIQEELEEIAAGGKDYSLEEMRQHWTEMRAEVRRKIAG